jgi:hypothetical protein
MNTNPLLSQFRILAAMQPYVLRVRPRGTDFHFGSEPEQAVAYTKCVREMRQILVEKRRIPAILGIIGQARFDSETFIEIVETITAALPQIRPRRLADNIRSLIHPESGGTRRPPIIDQWEAMPATTRLKVEAMVRPSRSLVRWLDNVADLLERERPARKQGAPRSISRVLVSRIATIWRTLRLNPGLAYNYDRSERVESAFQRYCRAALSAVGDSTKISARQVANYMRDTSAIRIR